MQKQDMGVSDEVIRQKKKKVHAYVVSIFSISLVSECILFRDDGNCVEGLVEVFDMLLAITSKFRELNLQREEYLCLKVMVLLNSSKSAEVQCEKKAD